MYEIVSLLPVVCGGGVSQGTEVRTGGPVSQQEAWLRAAQAMGGTGAKTFLPEKPFLNQTEIN